MDNSDEMWDPSNKEDIQKLRSNFKECLWQDLKCGDIILVEDGEHLAGDVAFLLSSAKNGECFV